MARLQIPWRWGMVATILMLIALCGAGSLMLMQSGNRRSYQEARHRWETQALRSYRVAISSEPSCTLESEVRNEQMARLVRADSCVHPARTVTELFTLIDRGDSSINCFFAGCICRLELITSAEYHPVYGYPLTIRMRAVRSANWWTSAFWNDAFTRRRLRDCAHTWEAEVIQSVELTPLEQ
jgi:hypothetical protein